VAESDAGPDPFVAIQVRVKIPPTEALPGSKLPEEFAETDPFSAYPPPPGTSILLQLFTPEVL
jgi:hypothetical protein